MKKFIIAVLAIMCTVFALGTFKKWTEEPKTAKPATEQTQEEEQAHFFEVGKTYKPKNNSFTVPVGVSVPGPGDIVVFCKCEDFIDHITTRNNGFIIGRGGEYGLCTDPEIIASSSIAMQFGRGDPDGRFKVTEVFEIDTAWETWLAENFEVVEE